ncbi:plasmid mobilization protein [Alcaligenes sp. CHO6]|uniref:plasmid mobilization protein n=1 Tax=Alcaligenes sp. CHO6 TaxID=3123298 RepID=UPI0030155527
MAEALTELLRVRITPSQKQNFSEAAALAGITPSEYARRLLTNAHSIQTEVVALRHAIEVLAEHQKASIESLLLLRQIVPMTKVEEAHQHMSMLGYQPLQIEA